MDEKNKLPKGLFLSALMLGLIATIILALLYYVLPSFEETFSNFGTDLPKLTHFIMQGYEYSIYLPIFIFGSALAAFLIKNKYLMYTSLALSVVAITMLPVAFVAVYLPIFTLD